MIVIIKDQFENEEIFPHPDIIPRTGDRIKWDYFNPAPTVKDVVLDIKGNKAYVTVS